MERKKKTSITSRKQNLHIIFLTNDQCGVEIKICKQYMWTAENSHVCFHNLQKEKNWLKIGLQRECLWKSWLGWRGPTVVVHWSVFSHRFVKHADESALFTCSVDHGFHNCTWKYVENSKVFQTASFEIVENFFLFDCLQWVPLSLT